MRMQEGLNSESQFYWHVQQVALDGKVSKGMLR